MIELLYVTELIFYQLVSKIGMTMHFDKCVGIPNIDSCFSRYSLFSNSFSSHIYHTASFFTHNSSLLIFHSSNSSFVISVKIVTFSFSQCYKSSFLEFYSISFAFIPFWLTCLCVALVKTMPIFLIFPFFPFFAQIFPLSSLLVDLLN